MEVTRMVHIAMEMWGIIFMLCAYFCEWLGRKSGGRSGRPTRHLILLSVLLLLGDILAWIFRGVNTETGRVITRISNAAVFMTYPLFEYCFSGFLMSSTDEEKWHRNIRRYFLALVLVTFILLVVNNSVPFLYAFDDMNRYYRMSGFPILYAAPVVGAFLVGYTVIKTYAKLDRSYHIVLPAGLTIIIFTSVAQLLIYGISLAVMGVSTAILMIFIFHQVEKSNELLVKEKELQELQTKQLQAQMQPHFLFNSLTTIRSLIRRDPDEAFMAVSDFSRYLRGSLSALQDVKEWSIDEELHMTEGYLSLEKRRFGDLLDIDLQIEDRAFSVPILTVETLAENAVRHGIREKKEGTGHLLIRTCQENDSHVVLIKDDGVGFDPNKNFNEDGRVHTGLANTKKRVESFGGELIVRSEPGKGTEILLRFPIKTENS